MGSIRIAWAAIVLLLLATSCTQQQTAERRPGRKSAPEPPSVASHSPESSLPADNAHAPIGSVRAFGPGRPERADPYPPRDPGRTLLADEDGVDTWEQIRFLMTLVPVRRDVSSLREFREKLRRYHGNQRFFDQLGRNARPWLYHVTRELAARGMPGEIALLPAVESGYNASAISARNAAGLWQILPGTARDLKLSRSWWYDARHDALAATPAALDYLASLHEFFDRDWMLAVAAYNCGPNNVRKAIRRAGLSIKSADYAAIERYLPAETRGHVARWLVLSEIVSLPRLHNVRIGTIPWRPYFAEVAAKPEVELETAARRSGMSSAELSRLNLGFRRGMVAPKGPHRLLVPAEQAGRLARELAQIGPVRHTGHGRYRVRSGDTLDQIARAHGTTVRTLMAANRLDSHLIRIGRELLIPGSPVRTASSDRPPTDTHIVSPGESLWLIARQYRTTVNALRDWNRLSPGSNLLHPGQRLRIRAEG